MVVIVPVLQLKEETGEPVVTSYVQKITFLLLLTISDVIFTAVSNQCPQGPPIWEFFRLKRSRTEGP